MSMIVICAGEGPVTLSIEDAEGATPDDIDIVILPPTGEEERIIALGENGRISSIQIFHVSLFHR